MTSDVIWFDRLSIDDMNRVGEKNASLGEMIKNLSSVGVSVPNGFAVNTSVYRSFLSDNGLKARIDEALNKLDVTNDDDVAHTSREIRGWIVDTPFTSDFIDAIGSAFTQLQQGDEQLSVAVRSSPNVAYLPHTNDSDSRDSFLNVVGIDSVLSCIKEVFASPFCEQALQYRAHEDVDLSTLELSVGVQHMVRSETAASGKIHTFDLESGFDQVVFISSAYGLGEMVMKGAVNADEFCVHKANLNAGKPAILRRNLGGKAVKMVYSNDPTIGSTVVKERVERSLRRMFSISNDEVTQLAKQALAIEAHYGQTMRIEWAKDGDDGRLYIVQARPETAKGSTKTHIMERYLLQETGRVLLEGRSIGHRIGHGSVRVVECAADLHQVQPGDVLVADMTDPDWEPILEKAAAIITNRGGRTCHAAIIARELGLPAIVGCEDATRLLSNGQSITVSCAEGDSGFVYDGILEFDVRTNRLDSMPELSLQLMMNIGNPDRAFDYQALPNAGVGLARLEFMINRMIGIHPKALLNFNTLPDDLKTMIDNRTAGADDPVEFYVEKIVEGISMLAAAFSEKPVIVRLSDFKSNEYANLIGGRLFEPNEENPMLGFRGASRYIAKEFRDCFELECRAIKRARDDMGFTNIEVMVPFVRTVGEAEQVVSLLEDNGLKRGENGLRLIMMCELPINALLADQFLEFFDGFSIGTNDLTQLCLGIDRDSSYIAHLFDERNDAVLSLLENAIHACKKANKYVGVCGQGPSEHPDFANWLMQKNIDSISLSPDSVLDTWFFLADR